MAVPRSVISANVKLALRCRSMFSEKTSVLRARSGSPEKKSVSPRCIRRDKSAFRHERQRGENDGQQHRKPSSARRTHVFEILKKVGNRLSLAIGESGLVEAIAGSPWKRELERETREKGRRKSRIKTETGNGSGLAHLRSMSSCKYPWRRQLGF